MDWLAQILTSGNALLVIIGLIALICLIVYFGKKGLFSFKGYGVSIGNGENERRIIRLQLEYVKAELDTFFEGLISEQKKKDKDGTFNEWHCRYCEELVYDIFTEAISLNHITADEFYVDSKLTKIWATLSRLDLLPCFRTEQFKSLCKSEATKIIQHLVETRKYYSSEK